MFERFARSWSLFKASAAILSNDRRLLLFPALSLISSLLLIAAFVMPMLGFGALDRLGQMIDGDGRMSWPIAIFGFVFYVAQYFVMFFFNSALAAAVVTRLESGHASIGASLRMAFDKIGPIFGYALIAATVGVILRAIQERAGWLGNIVVGLIGATWTVASFLVVPILVTRNIGPIDAVKESASLLRQTWGENLIAQGGMGLVFGITYFIVGAVGAAMCALFAINGKLALFAAMAAVLVASLLLLALIQMALSAIYSVALYRHASGEATPASFTGGALEQAFTMKA